LCKSAVLVGKELPNKPVQAERPSEVFIVAGVKLELVLPVKLVKYQVMFAGGVVLCIAPHFIASASRASA